MFFLPEEQKASVKSQSVCVCAEDTITILCNLLSKLQAGRACEETCCCCAFIFGFFFYCFCNVGKCLFNIYDITLQVFEIRLHKNIMQLMGTFSPSSPARALHHLKHLLTCFGIRLATKTAATTMLLSFISFNKSPNHIRGLLTFQGCHSQAVKVKSQCDCEGVLIACANFPPTENKLAHEVR